MKITKYKDPIFKSYLISKTINKFMRCGLKNLYEIHFYFLLKLLKFKHYMKNPCFYYFEAIEIIKPLINYKKTNNFKPKYILYTLNNSKSYNLAIS